MKTPWRAQSAFQGVVQGDVEMVVDEPDRADGVLNEAIVLNVQEGAVAVSIPQEGCLLVPATEPSDLGPADIFQVEVIGVDPRVCGYETACGWNAFQEIAVGLDDTGVGKNGQEGLHVEHVRWILEHPAIGPSAALKELQLA